MHIDPLLLILRLDWQKFLQIGDEFAWATKKGSNKINLQLQAIFSKFA